MIRTEPDKRTAVRATHLETGDLVGSVVVMVVFLVFGDGILVVHKLLMLAVRQRRQLLGRRRLVVGLFACSPLGRLSRLVLLADSSLGARSALLGLLACLVVHDTIVGLGDLLAIDDGRV